MELVSRRGFEGKLGFIRMVHVDQGNEALAAAALGGDLVRHNFADVVADGYARWVLDPVIEIGNAVARDFAARPEFYKAGDFPDRIVAMRVEYGVRADLPNRAQRQEILTPIFGVSDAYATDAAADKFRSLRKPLFDACITLAERTVSDPVEGLRQRVLSALQLFQPYLLNFDGVSMRAGQHQVESVSDLAYTILRSGGVSQVFGVVQPIPSKWPLASNDSNGALLIRAVGEKLQLAPECVFNEEKFQRLRRVAEQGGVALRAILTDGHEEDDQFDALVTAIYTWAISLKDYVGH